MLGQGTTIGPLIRWINPDHAAHYDVVLAAVSAARRELLHLHRKGLVHDELLSVLEHDSDLQEIAAVHG